MVKTEAQRRIIEPQRDRREPPKDVLEALRKHDSALELLWNEDDNRWEFYRLKETGPSRAEDVLHWQMSSPFTGSDIQPSIINWLRKYDTSELGRKGPDEICHNFKMGLKDFMAHPDKLRKKRMQPYLEEWDSVYQRYAKGRTQIAVPKLVGRDTKRGKNIYAVKKQPKMKIDRSIAHG